jgi:hypothetical protein
LDAAGQIHQAKLLRRILPGRMLRHGASAAFGILGWAWLANTCSLADHLDDMNSAQHPVNQVGSPEERDALEECFGAQAIGDAARQRSRLLERIKVPGDTMSRFHGAALLATINRAGVWATLFNQAGADLLFPYLDSRVIRLAINLPASIRFPFRRPKGLIRDGFSRLGGASCSFGTKQNTRNLLVQSLAPHGPLSSLVEQIAPYDFVPNGLLKVLAQRPNWFLFTLLVYDCWHKIFIKGSLAPERPALAPSAHNGRPLAA